MRLDDEYARDAFKYKCQHGFDCYEKNYLFNRKQLLVITDTNKKFILDYRLNLNSKMYKRNKIVIDSQYDGQLKFFLNSKNKGGWIFYHTSDNSDSELFKLCTKSLVDDTLRRLTSPQGFTHFHDVLSILEVEDLFCGESEYEVK